LQTSLLQQTTQPSPFAFSSSSSSSSFFTTSLPPNLIKILQTKAYRGKKKEIKRKKESSSGPSTTKEEFHRATTLRYEKEKWEAAGSERACANDVSPATNQQRASGSRSTPRLSQALGYGGAHGPCMHIHVTHIFIHSHHKPNVLIHLLDGHQEQSHPRKLESKTIPFGDLNGCWADINFLWDIRLSFIP
jgi:hypothetical protein